MAELFGRLARGADLEAARAELRAVHGAFLKEHPEAYPEEGDFRIDAVRLRDQITSPARTVLLVLLAASALVFVIARPMVAGLAQYAARFSVRALEVTVDASLLWVGVSLALAAAVLLAFVPRLPSAEASTGPSLSNGSVRITSGTNRRPRPFAVPPL